MFVFFHLVGIVSYTWPLQSKLKWKYKTRVQWTQNKRKRRRKFYVKIRKKKKNVRPMNVRLQLSHRSRGHWKHSKKWGKTKEKTKENPLKIIQIYCKEPTKERKKERKNVKRLNWNHAIRMKMRKIPTGHRWSAVWL